MVWTHGRSHLSTVGGGVYMKELYRWKALVKAKSIGYGSTQYELTILYLYYYTIGWKFVMY